MSFSSDSDEELIELYLLYRLERKRRASGVHESLKKRKEEGDYHTLFNVLRNDPARFRNYTRMSTELLDKLLGKVRDR